MTIYTETERLFLRELHPTDATAMFVLDSDPEVHRYVGNKPVTTIGQVEDVIQFIRQQYVDNGIGRWAVVEKKSGHFIGWAGLKLMKDEVNGHVNYYDIGYRFIRQYWGLGYATEAARAIRDYGFDQMNLIEINAQADAANKASDHVLLKTGLANLGNFLCEGVENNWYAITREEWKLLGPTK